MKSRHRRSLSVIALFAVITAVASLAVACKPSSDLAKDEPSQTVNQQIDKAQSAASEAAKDLNAYTYAQKKEFVAVMEKQLTALNRSLDELDAKVAQAGADIKAEAKPKLTALRAKSDLLTQQLSTVKDASSSTWESVKATTSKAYDELSTGFTQAREWLSEKIAP